MPDEKAVSTETLLEAAQQFARDRANSLTGRVTGELGDVIPTPAVVDLIWTTFRSDSHNCFLCGAVTTLRQLCGEMKPLLWSPHIAPVQLKGWMDEYWRRRAPAPGNHTAVIGRTSLYCACWQTNPSAHDYWHGVTDILFCAPSPGEEARWCAWVREHLVGLVLCSTCGRVAPWRGEKVGNITILGAAHIVRSHYNLDGTRRDSPLPVTPEEQYAAGIGGVQSNQKETPK